MVLVSILTWEKEILQDQISRLTCFKDGSETTSHTAGRRRSSTERNGIESGEQQLSDE